MTKPTIGRIVIYTLNLYDAENVNKGREAFLDHCKNSGIQPSETVFKGPMGNFVHEGDEFPALIVRVWGKEDTASVNLRVFLDGNDTFWATSKIQNDEGLKGSYRFPTIPGFKEAKAAPSNPVPVDGLPVVENSAPNAPAATPSRSSASPKHTVKTDK